MKLTINLYRFTAFVLLVLLCGNAVAQKDKAIQVGAVVMKNLIRDQQQVVRYLGNVVIHHQGATMNCDSAYLTKKLNIVEAFGHVIVTKDDSKLYGDYLYYDGNSSTGKISGKEVKMIQKDATLLTNTINFNTKTNSAYYSTTGILTNAENKLVSQKGYYYSQSKKYYFAGEVDMRGKDGRLTTDSLEYSTQDEVANFYGPTRIYTKDSSYVYCENGWYDRKNDKGNFLKDAFIDNKGQKLYGQDIFYDKKNGFSRIVGKVAIVDTTRKVTVYGGKANYWDKTKEVEVTENPLLLMVSNNDTLFLRTNRFLLKTIADSTLPDSTYRIIKALGEVRFFKSDIQGVCDSLIYNTKDSTISMFETPVLWNESNQISSDFIKAYTEAGNKIRRMEFEGNAFFIKQEDGINYNQIRGKIMIAHFTNGNISKLDVTGNGQAVYFLRDKGKIAAVNKAESTNLSVKINNNSISKISFKIKPVSAFYPIEKVDYEEITLKGFNWLKAKRPKSRMSIVPKGLDLVLTDAKKGFKRDL
jgi:lipopolysaccharide export system protein LptA